MVFIFNPYDATLDLTKGEDRKLFNSSCKGLDENNTFAANK